MKRLGKITIAIIALAVCKPAVAHVPYIELCVDGIITEGLTIAHVWERNELGFVIDAHVSNQLSSTPLNVFRLICFANTTRANSHII